VKSITGGPVSKAFNLNYARIYDEIDKQPVRPGLVYCGDDEAREVKEQLIRDAGYEPTPAGGWGTPVCSRRAWA
jgi:8-hydroxy-5-deazaflavin:NADPH oxidoreductase